MSRYRGLVYSYANRVLPEHDCDEVFQETFIAFYKQLEKLRQTENLAFWFAKVAERNTWKVLHRSRRSDTDSLPEEYEVEDPELIPNQVHERAALQELIRQNIGRLDSKCQALLTRLFYETEESDYQELARDLGIAMGSVGPTRNRCLVKLKKMLESEGVTKDYLMEWFADSEK